MVIPTVTVKIIEALRYAQQRARKVERTQQLEIAEGLFIRIAAGGRKFLLFQLEGHPSPQTAQAIAEALGLQRPVYAWHQGETLRSLTVSESSAAQGSN